MKACQKSPPLSQVGSHMSPTLPAGASVGASDGLSFIAVPEVGGVGLVPQKHGGALVPGGTPEGRSRGGRAHAEQRRARAERSEAVDDRRINSILHLRYVNLRLDQKPYGAIHWPADTDKTGKEWLVPISKDVRVAIDRILQQRPGIGAAFIFPSVNDASKPLAGDVASSWLMKAERLAKLPKQDGSLWHAYRRKWATERKHLSPVDVASAGGWTGLSSLQTCYQLADQATMFEVVSSPARLGEA